MDSRSRQRPWLVKRTEFTVAGSVLVSELKELYGQSEETLKCILKDIGPLDINKTLADYDIGDGDTVYILHGGRR